MVQIRGDNIDWSRKQLGGVVCATISTGRIATRLGTKAVESAARTLESVDDVESGDGLPEEERYEYTEGK